MPSQPSPLDPPPPAAASPWAALPGFFEGNSSCMLIIEPSAGRIVDANASAAAYYGYSREALTGMRIGQINTLPAEALADEMRGALREARKHFRFPHRLASGEVRAVEVYSTPILLEGRTHLLSIVHDIQDRKRAEDELAEKTRFLELVINHLPIQVFWKDRDLVYQGCNNIFAKVVGLADPGQVRGLTDFDFARASLHAESYREADRQVMASGEAILEAEERFHDGDDQEGCVLTSKVPIRDGQGEILGVLGISRDITRLRRAEARNTQLQASLQQARRMESLGGLAGGVAHDMNNVLGAILGLASAHLTLQPEGSPTGHAFATICEAATRGAGTVRNLLTFAHQRPGVTDRLDLNELLLENARLLERTTLAKVRLELTLAQDLAPVRGDPAALKAAVINLCVNAVDAMPEGGTLTIRTRNLDEATVEAQVEDTGTGMSKATLDRAMDPFFTTKEVGKGTGLGLSLVYTTLKAHGGHVELQSELGRGTRVTLRIPACPTESSAPLPPSSAPAAPATHGPLNILVVDDDELVQRSTQSVLDLLGHEATLAQCGEDALVEIQAGFRPDVIILDMNMPGLGGKGTLPRLRTLLPKVPVLLATGRMDATAEELATTHAGVTLLAKPYSLKDLEEHLGICHP